MMDADEQRHIVMVGSGVVVVVVVVEAGQSVPGIVRGGEMVLVEYSQYPQGDWVEQMGTWEMTAQGGGGAYVGQ
ncbi:hypothetical protein HDV00_009379 [Rhizophlyctis rosea]|nr:hypothetical protein HDV00_009379 [Rhizophlyctis rosea]